MKEQELINLVEKTLMGSLPPKQKVAECLLQIEQWKAAHPQDKFLGSPSPGDETGGWSEGPGPNSNIP